MHPLRFFIGLVLTVLPTVCLAQTSGSGNIMNETGATLRERLSILADGAMEPDQFIVREATRTAWTADVKRYEERRAELRSRCSEELRKANRDTITNKASQCLRSDLLLEISYRRKQQEYLETTPGTTVLPGEFIARWIDAAEAVIDGIDTHIFTNVDTIKHAKRNLHESYRVDMLHWITIARVSALRSIVHSLARIAHTQQSNVSDDQLSAITRCLEDADTHIRNILSLPTPVPLDVTAAGFRTAFTGIQTCRSQIEMLH